MFKKDIVTLSQHIQHIMLKIHQNRVQIIYKSGPEIFIGDWLSHHNHIEGKDNPINYIDIRINTIQRATDILKCMPMSQIQQASAQDEHLQCLKSFITTGWPNTKEELHTDLKPYSSYRKELAVIDKIVLKGRCIVILTSLRQHVLDQLHTNHVGTEKTKLLACKSVYWSSKNVDIEKYIKNCATCLEYQQMQPKEKIIHHNIPLGPWEVLGIDIFHFNNKNYICIVDYHSEFPIVKRLEGLSADSLITTTKVIFTEYGIP